MRDRLKIIAVGALTVVLAGIATEGRCDDDRRVVFDTPLTTSFSARTQPATVTQDGVLTLLGAGYGNIGTLEILRVTERCLPAGKGLKCEAVKHSDDALGEFLAEAARRGGDIVLLELNQEQGTEEFGRRGKCVAWEETVHYQSELVPFVDRRSGTISHKNIVLRPVSVRNCVQYETVKGRATTVTTAGSIWRRDPELAEAQRLNQEFLYAVALERLDRVKELIGQGLDPNTRNMNGDLALGLASVFGQNEVVAALLDAGADVNATDLHGTALHRAAANGNVETAKRLIAGKADVSARMPYGRHKGATPLFDAARSGSVELVRLLISNGALANSSTDAGVTPLMVAALEGQTGVIDALVDAGASIWASTKPMNIAGFTFQWTPLLMSILGRKHEAAMALVAYGSLIATEAIYLQMTIGMAFQDATVDKVFALASQLHSTTERWGYIDEKGSFVIPPRYLKAEPFLEGLAAACEPADPGKHSCGFIDRSGTFVIPAKYSSTSRFSEGLGSVSEVWPVKNPETNTFGACGYVDKTGRLVIPPKFGFCGPFSEGLAVAMEASRPKFGYLDKEGRWAIPPKFNTAQQFAGGVAWVSVQGRMRKVHKQIDRSGNFVSADVASKAGAPALIPISRDLLPVPILVPDHPKRRPWGYADSTATVIRITGPYLFAGYFTEGLAAVMVYSPEAEPLLEKWRALWREVSLGRRFMDAVRNGDVETARKLLEQGADVNARDTRKNTALLLAAGNGSLPMMKLLLEKGAQVNARNDQGYTALMLVPGTGSVDMARLLLEKGSDRNARNDLGLAAAEIAEMLGDRQVAGFLREANKR